MRFRPRLAFSLRIAIPLLVVAFALSVGYAALQHTQELANEQLEKESRTALTRLMTRLQGTLEYLIANDDFERVQAEIAALGSDPNIRVAVLADETETILAAMRRDQVGADLKSALSALQLRHHDSPATLIATARESRAGQIGLCKRGCTLAAAYPVSLGVERGGLRPARVGVLYVQLDLVRAKRLLEQSTYHNLGQLALLTGVLALGLLVFFHFAITRRVARLVDAVNRFARGDHTARTAMTPNDELGRVGAAFDDMARVIGQSQDQLEERAEEIRLLLDSTAEGLYGIDLEGRCTLCNRAAARMLGYDSPEALLGRPIHDLIHHSHADGRPYPESQCQIEKNLERGLGAHSTREVFWRADGSSFPVEYWSHPIRKGTMTLGGVVSFLDITERLETEAALANAKERAEVTLHSIGDAVITTDAKGNVEYLNPVAERITGWGAEEAAGRPLDAIFTIINELTRKRAIDPVQRCLREGEVVELTNHTLMINRFGEEIPIEDSAAPIRDRGGDLVGVVMVFHDVSRTRELARRLAWQASHDALTGLLNRAEFEQYMTRALDSAHDLGNTHALVYVDIDQFKILNDTSGHVAGDELLKQLSRLLSQHVRTSDVLARLGGDEFGLLLENCPLIKAHGIAKELRDTINGFRFAWEDRLFDVSASIGVVSIDAFSESIAQVLSAADIACFAAKEAGRNRIHVYEPNDKELAQRRSELHLVSDINEALEKGRFRLFGQPIVPTAGDGAIPHYEVLLRMADADGQLVPPGAFIPAAERFGVMPAIDRWVIRTLFAEYGEHIRRTWETATETDTGPSLFSVNLSGGSLADEDLIDFVGKALSEFGVPPAAICFEITETAAITNLSTASRFIGEMRELGCRFSLDDFGSGLSSFAYLKNLPVDFLKIDGSFVRDMVHDPIDAAMVESINHIGHVMKIRTIAEFVENDAIFARLREIHVDFAQGYGIGRPAPLDELIR